ncbi:MAG: glutamate racemase [Anaerolineae bacterium]|nr:glutamate racemase [Anaerolineae bacterium]
MTNQAQPIGVFDSGVGGLSVLRALVAELPGEDFVYVADSAHCPYGPRPVHDIQRLSHAMTDFLIAQGAKLIVVACNTASAAALTYLRATFPIPFVGMVPALKPAVGCTRTGHVGVLATAGTFQGELFADVVARFGQGVRVHVQVGHGLVELVEAGEVEGPRAEAAVERCLRPLLEADVDTLVLGCTHYPFLTPTLERVSQGRLTVVEPSAAIAAQTRRVLAERGWLNGQPRGKQLYYTTGDRLEFGTALSRLMGVQADVDGVRSDYGHSTEV